MANPRWNSTASTDWSTAGNWDPSGVPADGDGVYVQDSAVSIDTNLGQSAVQPASLHFPMSYTGRVGTAAYGSGYLDIGPVGLFVGAPSSGQTGGGSPRLKINSGVDPVSAVVYATSASATEAALAPFRWKGTNAANRMYVHGGKVGVAVEDPDELATLLEFSITGKNASFAAGAGLTWTTGLQTGGTALLNSGGGTFNQIKGTATFNGSGMVRDLVAGGTVNFNARAATTTCTITRTGSTATAATPAAHGHVAGDVVYLSGASQAGYNGFKTLLSGAGTTFTFACAADDVTPATGTITVLRAINTLEILNGGRVIFGADSRDVAVATLKVHPGGRWSFCQSDPTHLVVGSYSWQGGAGGAAASAS